LSGTVLQQQLQYWHAQLADAPPLLTLPTDRARPPVQSYRGSTLPFVIPSATTAALHVLGREAGCTLFMTLAAAFNVLLARYSGQTDICIGTPIANRNRAETEAMIGFFVNTLVLRAQIDPQAGFDVLLQQVRTSMLDAYAHQDVPFEQLVETLKPERHLSHAPLFQVMLSLQNTPLETLTLPGLTLEPMAQRSDYAKFDLSLELFEDNGQLEAAFEFNTDLFDAATIERMASHFNVLLAAIVAAPTCRIEQLDMLGAAERELMLQDWNRSESDYRLEESYAALFARTVAADPQRIAVSSGEQRLSYAELDQRSTRLAHALLASGVTTDALVVLEIGRAHV